MLPREANSIIALHRHQSFPTRTSPVREIRALGSLSRGTRSRSGVEGMGEMALDAGIHAPLTSRPARLSSTLHRPQRRTGTRARGPRDAAWVRPLSHASGRPSRPCRSGAKRSSGARTCNLTERQLRRRTHRGTPEWATAIAGYPAVQRERPQPLVRTQAAGGILAPPKNESQETCETGHLRKVARGCPSCRSGTRGHTAV